MMMMRIASIIGDDDNDDGGNDGDDDDDDGGNDGDDDDGDDSDDDDDDDDDGGRKMMIWTLRRRKKMKLRRMMLRRKTDSKTGKHTLCEPALSKCTWTCHKRHFVRKFTGKMPDASNTTSIEHWALTVNYRQKPLQCGHTVWAKKHIKHCPFCFATRRVGPGFDLSALEIDDCRRNQRVSMESLIPVLSSSSMAWIDRTWSPPW